MAYSRLLISEIKLLFKQKITLFVLFIFYVFMIMGINSINNSNEMMLHGIKRNTMTIAYGSASYGGVIGILLFCIIVVLTLSKDKSRQSFVLIDAAMSYSKIIVARLLAVMLLAISSVFLGMLLIMGIQGVFFKIYPELSIYLYVYLWITLLPIIFAILISSGLYLMWHSIDLSILITGVLFALGMSGSHYLMLWSKPWAPVFSDFAGINPIGKLLLYNRLLWISIAGCVFLLGILLRRRYDFSLFASFGINAKRIYLVAMCAVLFATSVVIIAKEPYMSKRSIVKDIANEEAKEIEQELYLQKLHSEVTLNTSKDRIIGEAAYTFDNKKQKEHIVFQVNEGLSFKEIKVNNKPVAYNRKNEKNIVINIPKENNIVLQISYEGVIKYDSAMGMAGYIDEESIYLLENANWLPTPRTNTVSQMIITGVVTTAKALEVVTPGKLVETKEIGDLKEWSYALRSSSVSIGLFAGKYKKTEIQAGGMAVEFYYSPKHEPYIKNKKLEEYIEKMVQYYTKTFGAYYSKEHPLKIVETAIYKPGGHSSSNIVTIAEYMFNREISARSDRPDYGFIHDLEIIAHEISHQWWGTGVELEEERPWSSEGLANYSAYKFIQHEFQEGQCDFVSSSWYQAVQRQDNSYYGQHPEKIQILNESYKNKMKVETLKVDLYYRMPIMLLQCEKSLGEEKFLQGLSTLYQKNLYRKITYDIFLEEMKLTKEVMRVE